MEDTEKKRYFLKLSSGETAEVEVKDLERGLSSGSIHPLDLLSRDGQAFFPLIDLEPFKDSKIQFAHSVKRYCDLHPENPSTIGCTRCERSYCDSCSHLNEIRELRTKLCPACEGILKPREMKWLEVTFWKDLKRVLFYPVDGVNLIYTLSTALFLFLVASIILGLFIFLVLALWIISQVVAASARGEKTMVKSRDEDFWDIFKEGAKGLFFTAGFWCLIFLLNYILNPAGDIKIVKWLLISFGLIYFPMAIGIIFVEKRWILAFQPLFVLRPIFSIAKDYFFHLPFFLTAVILGYLSWKFLPPSLPGTILSSLLTAYLSVLWAHIIGWTIYINRDKIDI